MIAYKKKVSAYFKKIKLFDTVKKGLNYLIVCVLLIGIGFELPYLHYSYIRNMTSSTLVTVLNDSLRGGGTGFHVKTPKGNVYIMTNSHVCDLSSDGININIETPNKRVIKRRIIENSDKTDLCLIEAVPGSPYLTLGKKPRPGEIVAAVGHPHLLPDTMTRGEVISEMQISIPIYPIFDDNHTCTQPKNSIKKMKTFFGELTVCVVNIEALMTTVPVLPGSSGSPLINVFGKLCGVIFAGNNANWGLAVQLSEIEKFLSEY